MFSKRVIAMICIFALMLTNLCAVSVSAAVKTEDFPWVDDFESGSSTLVQYNASIVEEEGGENSYLRFYKKTTEDYSEDNPDYASSGQVYVESMPLHFALTVDIYQAEDNTEDLSFEYYADDFDGDSVSDAFGGATISKDDVEPGVWYTLSLKKLSGTTRNGVYKAILKNKETGVEKMVVPYYAQNVSMNTTYNRFMFRSRNAAGSITNWYIDNMKVEENFDFELPSRIVTVNNAYPGDPIVKDGITWSPVEHVKGTVDDKTTDDKNDDEYISTEVFKTAYLNEQGNILVTTKEKKNLSTNVPYGVYLYSSKNNQTGNPINPANFTPSNDFETRIKSDDFFYIVYYTGNHRFYLCFGSDSVIRYNDKDNVGRMIEADMPYNKWMDVKLSVRDEKWGTVSINGREIITYELPKTATMSPYVQYMAYKDDGITNLEIASAKVTPIDTESLYISSISHNDRVAEGESVTLKTNLSTESQQATYYINGISVGTDKVNTSSSSANCESGATTITTNDGLTIAELKAGVYDIVAECDGKTSQPIRIFVDGQTSGGSAGGYSNGDREYILEYDYDGESKGEITVNDGYFTLDFSHNGKTLSYRALNNSNATFTGIENGIGAGKYKIVVTSGYAEVYYNNQFAFSTFLPYTYSEDSNKSFTHSGLENVTKNPSGVKTERYHTDWDGQTEFVDYNVDIGMFYSFEFDKLDTSNETIVVYDGEYQAKLTFDERGITAEGQKEDYEVNEEFLLTDSVQPGYYRLTVARGLAQLFRNNEYIHSFKCAALNHRDGIFRGISNPEGTTFVAVKNTDDIYFHSEDFEGNNELAPLNYWASEMDGFVLGEGVEDPFTEELVTEDGNTYLKITDVGLEEYITPTSELTTDPVGDYNLNVSADNPTFKWRAKADGTGAIHFMGRHMQRAVFLSFGYDFDTSQWILAQHDRLSDSGTYYDGRTILTSNSGSLDTNWHDYELIMNEGDVSLLCDGNTVLSYSGLKNAHGRLGFGVSKGASLSIDDIEYSGEGKVSPGVSYMSAYNIGSKDFHYNPKHGGVIAASSNASSFLTKDGGKTWEPISGGFGNCALNLLSGGFMLAGYGSSGWNVHRMYSSYYPAKAYEYWGNGNRMINGIWGRESLLIEPAWFDDAGYGRSVMPSRLVQVQDGKYKGRVFFTRDACVAETYGKPVLFYTDADIEYDPNDTSYYDGTTNKLANSKLYEYTWTQSESSLFYDATGVNGQEPQVVDLPNDVIRFFVRTDCGFIYYADSYDGGATFGEMAPTQLIAPRCTYDIIRDPQNLDHYYAFFEYDANTSDKDNNGGRPRTRAALAVSYDGMKNWHYLMDMEELTDNWKESYTPMNHGMRVIDGVVYMSTQVNRGYSKLYAVDLSKAKPLLRFSEVHDKDEFYTNVAGDIEAENCVLPKNSGMGRAYGEDITVNVENGKYSKNAIEAVFGVTEKSAGIFDFCGTEITIPADENGNYDIKKVADAFSKNITETENAYVISNSELCRVNIHQMESMGIEKTYDEDMKAEFVNSLNVASEYGLPEQVKRIIQQNAKYLTTDIENLEDSAYEAITGMTFYDVSDVDAVLKAVAPVGSVYVSTIGSCFEDWTTISADNALNVETEGNLATVENNGYYESGNSFGITTKLPDDGYNVEFEIKPEENTAVKVHFGNGNHKVEFGLVAESDEEGITVASNVWTTFRISVSGGDINVQYGADNEEMKTLSVDADYDGSDIGLWFDVECGKLQLKNVRVYSGESTAINFGKVCFETENVAIPQYAGENNLTRVNYVQNPSVPAEGQWNYVVTTFDAKNSVKGMPLAVHISGYGVGSEITNFVDTISLYSSDDIFDEWYSYKVVSKQVHGTRDMVTVGIYRKKAETNDAYESIKFLDNNGGRISSAIGNIRFGYRTSDEKYAYADAILADTVWEVANVKVMADGPNVNGYITKGNGAVTAELEIVAPGTVAEPIIGAYDGGRFVASDGKTVANGEGCVMLSVPVGGLSNPETRLFMWKSLAEGVPYMESVIYQ